MIRYLRESALLPAAILVVVAVLVLGEIAHRRARQ